jgi:hypothetical protein
LNAFSDVPADQCRIGLTQRRKGAKNTFLLCAFAPLRETSAFAFSEEKSCQENKKSRDVKEEWFMALRGTGVSPVAYL